MTSYVYVIGPYGEHGNTHQLATLEREKLPEILTEGWGDWDTAGEMQERLASLLRRPDSELAGDGGTGWDLLNGWGGPQLHVVPLR